MPPQTPVVHLDAEPATPGPDSIPPQPPGSPAAPERRPGPAWAAWEAFVLLALFFGAQLLFSGIALAVVGRLMPGLSSGGDIGKLVLYSLPVGLLASYLVTGLGVYWLLVRRHRQPLWSSLGLGAYPPLRLIAPFLGGFLLQFATAVLVAFFPPPEDQQFLFDVFLAGGFWSMAFFFVVAVGLAPLLEEVLFRGLLFPAMRRRCRFLTAAMLVTLLFAALHAFQTGTYWPALTGIFLCGWLLAWLRERHGALWPPVAFHIGFNFTAFIPIFLFNVV
ncbi:MAG: CPBP family intramembrane glutamic endopeptidase [bacterium]